MKKFSIVLCTLALILSGCSDSTDSEQAQLRTLLSTDADQYSLLVVGGNEKTEQNWMEWQDKNEINNAMSIRWERSLEQINQEYEFLDLNKSPAFVVFDNKGIVLKTYSETELIEFLRSKEG